MLEVKLLLVIMVANGVPVLLHWGLRDKLACPVDFGYILANGQPLLGSSKTWRGILGAILITPGASLLLGLGIQTGLIIAALAMLGDLAASFTKRRLGIPPSGIAPGLDQIPESLLPLWGLQPALGLGWQQILLIVMAFIVAGYGFSFVLFRLHIRSHPY
jgi:hypothetical protein